MATPRRAVRCAVTGGSGFLGRVLVERLIRSESSSASAIEWDVLVLDIREFPITTTSSSSSSTEPPSSPSRLRSAIVDLRDYDALLSSLTQTSEPIDVVFHCASAVPNASNAHAQTLMHQVNVLGTQNVIRACAEANIKSLVYTSSASVVFTGKDLVGTDETCPIPALDAFPDFYTRTKAEAEALVLGANAPGTLLTCALRPSGIFGEYDPLLVPQLVDNARRGKSKFIVGDGRNMMDWTYVGNVAQAHELAAVKLMDANAAAAAACAGSANELELKVDGEAFFITNAEPRLFWGFLGELLAGLGYEKPEKNVPFAFVYLIALVVAFFTKLLAPVAQIQSNFTPLRILLMTCNRQVSCEKAKLRLGYTPEVSVDDAIAKTLAYFAPLRAEKAPQAQESKKSA